MDLEQYPNAPSNLLGKTPSRNGVSVAAQPLLGEKESKAYFGVDLIKNDILAVHITVRNDNANKSYLVPADSLQITQRNAVDNVNTPEDGDQQAGEAIGVASVVLISPALLAVAVQQLSDASIIKENFEAQKFRTTTIDPGETVGGFSYFNWAKVEMIDSPELCLKLVDTVENASFPYCLEVAVRR
jgi:hypothetical protein